MQRSQKGRKKAVILKSARAPYPLLLPQYPAFTKSALAKSALAKSILAKFRLDNKRSPLNNTNVLNKWGTDP